MLQPSVTLGRGGFSLNVWGNRDLTGANGFGGDFTEIDYTVDYSWEWRELVLSAGAVYYDFPHDIAAGTVEVYGAVGLDMPLSPALTVYADVDEADGAYASLSVGRTIPDVWQPAEGVKMSVDLSAAVGFGSSNWNRFYFGEDESAVNDLLLSAGLPFELGGGWTLTPSLYFSALLDEDIRDAQDDQSNLWAGLTVSYSF